jgi:hypothetical protein
MVQYLSDYKIIEGIDECNKDFVQKLGDFYDNDIIEPKKDCSEMICTLKNEYKITETDIDELDPVTQSLVSNMSGFQKNKIWILPYSKVAAAFYKELYSHYFRIDNTPLIFFFYDMGNDVFVSDSSFFQTAIFVYRGINAEDVKKKNTLYKLYLNSMYMLSNAIKTYG